MKDKGILIIYGSLNSVPSPEGAAPAKVIYETVETLNDSRFKVLSNYNPRLNDVDYDRSRYLHVTPHMVDKCGLQLLKMLYPFKKRKVKFSTSSDPSLLYFISICRFLLFNRYKKIIVHVSVGMVTMIKLVFPKRNVVFYHHGTSLHSKYTEQQWKQLITNSKAVFGVNRIAFQKANHTFKNKLEASKYFAIPNAIVPQVSLEQAISYYNNRPFSPKTFVFAFSGRICVEKGVLNLLHAFEKVYETNKNVALVVFGAAGTRETHGVKTEYLKKCHDFAEYRDLPITFTGFLSSEVLLKSISEVDVIILSTDNKRYEEGMPLCLIEGASLGKPILATNSGGNFEVVKDNINGMLIKSNPYIGELADAMLKISLDKVLYAKFSKAAYSKYVENHTYQSYNKSFMKALKEISFLDD